MPDKAAARQAACTFAARKNIGATRSDSRLTKRSRRQLPQAYPMLPACLHYRSPTRQTPAIGQYNHREAAIRAKTRRPPNSNSPCADTHTHSAVCANRPSNRPLPPKRHEYRADASCGNPARTRRRMCFRAAAFWLLRYIASVRNRRRAGGRPTRAVAGQTIWGVWAWRVFRDGEGAGCFFRLSDSCSQP